ncbi:MAG: YdcH family protein [Deltaproteobacteria bacterium]|nr:YdcH family protein [Deltaproteobacteria bacterium]
MEPKDMQLIEQHSTHDATLAKLWQEHVVYEQQLDKLERKPYLTTDEQVERNRLKKLKLAGRDRIETILAQYRSSIQAKSNAG